MKILVVDDDETWRELLEMVLSNLFSGMAIVLAKDGSEGLELFLKHKPDLVISDVDMPRMSGLELLQAIKAEAPEIPVIIITGFCLEAGERESMAMEAGAVSFFIKPFAVAEFIEEVEKLLLQQ